MLGLVQYNPLRASSYIPLPKSISKKRACLNINNFDDKCFTWCVLASLHPLQYRDHPERVTKYLQYENELVMKDIEYPVAVKDINRFENLNNISVNVYGLDQKVFPMRITKKHDARHHVDLLYLAKDEGGHYVLIKDMSRLVSKQLSKNTLKKFHACTSQEILHKHLEKCELHGAQRIKMPDQENKVLQFKKIEAQERLPFVIYADFESILEQKEIAEKDPSKSWTEKCQRHFPCGFGMHTVCTDKRFHSQPKIYFGEDSAEKFLDMVQRESKLIRKFLKNKIQMERLSSQQWREYNAATTCHICKKVFKEGNQRVRDHDHLTGKLCLFYYMILIFITPSFVYEKQKII